MIMQTIKHKSLKFWIIKSLLGVLLVTIFIFSYINMKGVIDGVTINANIITTPEKTSVSKISGTANHAKFLTLNGREINIDKNGNFSEDIALSDGYSVLTIKAIDQFGKDSLKTIEVYTVNSKSVAVGTITKNIINN